MKIYIYDPDEKFFDAKSLKLNDNDNDKKIAYGAAAVIVLGGALITTAAIALGGKILYDKKFINLAKNADNAKTTSTSSSPSLQKPLIAVGPDIEDTLSNIKKHDPKRIQVAKEAFTGTKDEKIKHIITTDICYTTCNYTASNLQKIFLGPKKDNAMKAIDFDVLTQKSNFKLKQNDAITYRIQLDSQYLDFRGEKVLFQGHDFFVVQYLKNGEPRFRFMQSWIQKYTLESSPDIELSKVEMTDFLTSFEKYSTSKIYTEEMANFEIRYFGVTSIEKAKFGAKFSKDLSVDREIYFAETNNLKIADNIKKITAAEPDGPKLILLKYDVEEAASEAQQDFLNTIGREFQQIRESTKGLVHMRVEMPFLPGGEVTGYVEAKTLTNALSELSKAQP